MLSSFYYNTYTGQTLSIGCCHSSFNDKITLLAENIHNDSFRFIVLMGLCNVWNRKRSKSHCQ